MERLTLNDNERLSRLNVPFLSFFSEEKTEENVRCEKRKRERRGADLSLILSLSRRSRPPIFNFDASSVISQRRTEMEKIGR